ncbi:MAG: NAD-dependent epimerase/dehydratase family protein [Thaumarchaeota archaeon]|nr:NAD-dependent epimerase/dehydratase family protein [Nitrososphaerota archaeon]
MSPRVLVTGAAGQIGAELVPLLRSKYGRDNVVAGLHRAPGNPALKDGPSVTLDVGDPSALTQVVDSHGIDTIYHLAALLSATGEKNPQLAWQVNMDGLRNVLEVSRSKKLSGVFWPSSIAVYGPDAPRAMAPQAAPLNPTTMYGVTKVSGELLCNYYFLKYGLDVRILRYPGLISSEALPGGGTTDYAVEIFYEALKRRAYTCFLREDTVLPMMYMPDALDGTVKLMEADAGRVPRHMGYNLAAISFSAGEIAAEIKKHISDFHVDYAPESTERRF